MSTVNIPIRAKRELRNNWHEVVLRAGERAIITAMYQHVYKLKRCDKSERLVLRSWLVECGALEPLPSPSQGTGAATGWARGGGKNAYYD
jgi:hypothetical protein